jgi:hypothetical protein
VITPCAAGLEETLYLTWGYNVNKEARIFQHTTGGILSMKNGFMEIFITSDLM